MKSAGEYQKRRRNERKEKLIALKGGCCSMCGYNKSASALVFHHKDAKTKEFNISGKQLTRKSWKELKKEAQKCVLLCFNCHIEIHDREGWIHENGEKTVKAPRRLENNVKYAKTVQKIL